jgi:hypothetical protein
MTFYNKYYKMNLIQLFFNGYEDIFDKQDNISELLKVGKLNMINKSKRKIAIKI